MDVLHNHSAKRKCTQLSEKISQIAKYEKNTVTCGKLLCQSVSQWIHLSTVDAAISPHSHHHVPPSFAADLLTTLFDCCFVWPCAVDTCRCPLLPSKPCYCHRPTAALPPPPPQCHHRHRITAAAAATLLPRCRCLRCCTAPYLPPR